MPSPRQLSLQLLKRWDQSRRQAQDLLGEARDKTPLTLKERAQVQHLLFGVLRQRRLLDFWIGHLRKGKLGGEGRRLLQLGLFQLFHTRSPDHAAVHETLRLAPPYLQPMANALLRRAAREREQLEAMAARAPAAIRYSLPDFLYDKWVAQFGQEETIRLCQWCQTPAPVYLRRNGLRREARQLLRDHQLAPAEVRDRDDFFAVEKIPKTILDAGAGYIQDPSTVLACDLLGVRPGQRVLDACAAPGGKTAYLAQLMNNSGTLLATDGMEHRRQRLRENLDRLGVECAEVRSCDWKDPGAGFGMFDRILLDLPCSNTGVLRRRVDLRWRLKPGVFDKMANLQTQLATQILKQLRPGGQAVYSTCSVEPEENESVVQRLSALDSRLERRKIVRCLPQRDGFDGAFAALLVKHPT